MADVSREQNKAEDERRERHQIQRSGTILSRALDVRRGCFPEWNEKVVGL